MTAREYIDRPTRGREVYILARRDPGGSLIARLRLITGIITGKITVIAGI